MQNKKHVLLGVNIDHVATLRQTRDIDYPSPIEAAMLAEQSGADGITVHLREDRRHIQDADVIKLATIINTRLNLEMAATPEMVKIAQNIQPAHVCLVPEKREELTTEGGLDVITNITTIQQVVHKLQESGIRVSLFIDPDVKQIEMAKEVGAQDIELHTGAFAAAATTACAQQELQTIISSVKLGKSLGLRVNAGHGLNYNNVQAIAAIAGLYELNIGHAIISQAVMIGLPAAVKSMKELILGAQLL